DLKRIRTPALPVMLSRVLTSEPNVLTQEAKTRPFACLGSRIPLLRLYALRAELRFAPTESQRLFILTVIIGIMCGLSEVAFPFAIAEGDSLLIGRAMSMPGNSWMLWGGVSPALGGLVSGVLLKFVVP